MGYKTGNDVYVLPAANKTGTSWSCIWDAGGQDTLSNEGVSRGCVIDLRAAPLTGENAGGYVSSANGIIGGFTIANTVVIENAIGGDGDDRLNGNAAGNQLRGNGGDDTISGANGNDNVVGGTGGDTLSGGNGNDRLSGGSGNDTMTGGGGADTFVFDKAPGRSNVDRVTDYNVAADTIRIDNAAFAGLATGTLAAGAFVRNTSGNAQDASDRIIYESDTGKLYFDRDGIGWSAKVHFATLSTNLTLTQADFIVI
jgi:serralysin